MRPTISRGGPRPFLLRAGWVGDTPSPRAYLTRRVSRGQAIAELVSKQCVSRWGFEPVWFTVPCPATTSGVGSIARSASANERPSKLLFAAARQPGNQNGHHRT